MNAQFNTNSERLNDLFRALFLIQQALNHFSDGHCEYQSDVDTIAESVDDLISKMIEDYEKSLFD